MKIKILQELPVQEEMRPPIGSVHEVIDETSGRDRIYYINFNGKKVGVYAAARYGECEVVRDGK